tara:strand:+ start:611 stop:880 length:270 start_codon:yes stop_codon:yes gene_type:complete
MGSCAFGDIWPHTCRTYPADRFSQHFAGLHQSEYFGQHRTCDVRLVSSGIVSVIFENGKRVFRKTIGVSGDTTGAPVNSTKPVWDPLGR